MKRKAGKRRSEAGGEECVIGMNPSDLCLFLRKGKKTLTPEECGNFRRMVPVGKKPAEFKTGNEESQSYSLLREPWI